MGSEKSWNPWLGRRARRIVWCSGLVRCCWPLMVYLIRRSARRSGYRCPTVLAWRHQFEEDGLAEFGVVATGRGPKPSISEEKIAEIVELTLHSKPEGQTHWSCRSMAEQVGVSPATVQRIWSARGLKPHLVTTFKLSNDRHFQDKLIDVSACTSTLPIRPWCCAWTRSPRSGAGPDPALAATQARPGRHHDS